MIGRRWLVTAAATGLVVLVAFAFALSPPAAADDAPPQAVLVELFTSQGCSSCPPADRLLVDLAGTRRVAGRTVEVIPLAFHVDYWDAIGWPDPFASPRWTARQREYARWFEEGRIYTPQLVVAGGRHAVGSSRERALALIGWAAASAPRVVLTVRSRPKGASIEVSVTAKRLDAHGPAPRVYVAVHDGGHSTRVEAGENARKTLRNEWVVRHLEAIFDLDRRRETVRRGRIEITVDAAWQRQRLGVVVFAQDPETGAIVGAISADGKPA